MYEVFSISKKRFRYDGVFYNIEQNHFSSANI